MTTPLEEEARRDALDSFLTNRLEEGFEIESRTANQAIIVSLAARQGSPDAPRCPPPGDLGRPVRRRDHQPGSAAPVVTCGARLAE
jgi:hypothetical protein